MIEITASVFCTSLGAFLFRREIIPRSFPNLLGRLLYWLGVPLQILVLTRKSNLSQSIWLLPIATIATLLLGLGLACVSLQLLRQLTQNQLVSPKVKKFCKSCYPKNCAERGSFMLSAIFGSTGFAGLVIVPAFVDSNYLAWVVLYSVTHILVGSYGIGVLLANYFGKSQKKSFQRTTWRDLLCIPSLWTFLLSYYTHHIHFPRTVDLLLQAITFSVVPGALFLIGMQLSQLQSFQSLRSAIVPSTIKMLVLPGLVGLAATLMGVSHGGCLTLVLMSGMPTAFTNAILAEEYHLSSSVTSSSIILSTMMLPIVIPLWLFLFR
ncbi:transporter [Cyanosarcina cf. burmensis CCALA 770]|nr:transporter [Cyanosarcina cf. burmensis CCALA 770]